MHWTDSTELNGWGKMSVLSNKNNKKKTENLETKKYIKNKIKRKKENTKSQLTLNKIKTKPIS